MALDPRIEPKISALVEHDLPRFYREEAPLLRQLLVRYFEWLESEDGALYHSRRILDYGDVDASVNEFLSHIRAKVLPGVNKVTRAAERTLLKHSLDFYRSRGTSRAIDLLFRAVFGVGARVYQPGRDLLRPSSGEWVLPRYLEVTLRDDLSKFVGFEIYGVKSGAKAYCERVSRKMGNGRIIDLMHISAISGQFQTGEHVNSTTNKYKLRDCPVIIGSLTSLIITDGGDGYAVGDLVSVRGTVSGYGALARVASVSNTVGTVTFNIEHGGYGYSNTANIYVSEKVLTLSNVTSNTDNHTNNYFYLFETVSQPLANLNYIAATGSFTNNDNIQSYWDNGSVKGTGKVLSVVATNSTAGALFIYVVSGNMSSNTIGTVGNSVTANLPVANGYIDKTAAGNVIAEGNTVVLDVTLPSVTLEEGELIFQLDVVDSGGISSEVVTARATIETIENFTGRRRLTCNSRSGIFREDAKVMGQTSGGTANVTGVRIPVGLITVNNQFIFDSRANVITSASGTKGIINNVSSGSGASADVGLLDLTEEVIIATDFLDDYLVVGLDDPDYGLPASQANLNTVIANGLTLANVTIGRIASFNAVAPGANYSINPLVLAHETTTSGYHKTGWQLHLVGLSTDFQEGELVTQAATGARGLVRAEGAVPVEEGSGLPFEHTLILDRCSLLANFVPTINSTTIITGQFSGTTGNVIAVWDLDSWAYEPADIDREYVGIDARIGTETTTATGAVVELEIVASGYGFTENSEIIFGEELIDGEEVIFSGEGNQTEGLAIAKLGDGAGRALGFYRTRDGFLSSTKKLPDGDYWQEFSYEIRSPITLDKYSGILKRLLHVAGTKAFGAMYHENTANASLTASPVEIKIGPHNWETGQWIFYDYTQSGHLYTAGII